MAHSSATMSKVSMRNIRSHKLRFFLTILSVVLGTAFIAGSFMFTNSLSSAFDSIVQSSYQNVDAVASTKKDSNEAIDDEFRQQLSADPRVEDFNISSGVQIVAADDENNTFEGNGGAPTAVQTYYPDDQQIGAVTPIVEGRAPHGAEEVVVNQSAAERMGIEVGDRISLIDPSKPTKVTVVGIYSLDMEVGGYFGALMEVDSFLATFRSGGVVDELLITSAQNESPEAFVEYLKGEYPGVDFTTGAEKVKDETAEINSALSFVNYFLLAFGLIALLVGTFIIANTFSMIVAQRMREFALLRALGTSQGQLTASVVLEAVVIGLIGSLLGVAAGFGLAKLIFTVLESLGMGLPAAGLSLTPTSVVVPLLLGVLVTVLSAWAPARRAGQVRPVEAMRMGDTSSNSSLKVRTISGAVVLLLGLAAAVIGGWILVDAATGQRASLIGGGAVLMILGTFLVSPALSMLVVPLIGRAIGWPFGAVGKLARTNSQRNPRRTATTAFALTLGVALVAAIGMFGATMKNSVTELTESSIDSDYIVAGPSGAGPGQFPVQRGAIAKIKELDGVQEAVTFGVSGITAGGGSGAAQPAFTFVMDGDPSAVTNIEPVAGDVDFHEPGVLAGETFAKEQGWTVGQEVPLRMGGSGPELATVPLRGIYKDNQVLGNTVLSDEQLTQVKKDVPPLAGNSAAATTVQLVAVNGKEGTDLQQLRQDLETTVDDFVILTVQTKTEFAGAQAVMVDQMLNILYGLLALAVVVAILGIINTLALNVVERRQEVGMLRAVGTKRMQIRTMITLEAVQISVYGALVGTVLGVFLGWAFINAMEKEGLTNPVVPWDQLLFMVLGSAVVGMIAAVWPAHKAAATPPLEAIAD